MQEISAPLKLTVKVTVPIVCNISRDCSVVIRITQDNSEVYLSLCSLRFTNGSAAQAIEIAVKRDFTYGRDKQAVVRFEIENLNDPGEFINHRKLPDIVVSSE